MEIFVAISKESDPGPSERNHFLTHPIYARPSSPYGRLG